MAAHSKFPMEQTQPPPANMPATTTATPQLTTTSQQTEQQQKQQQQLLPPPSPSAPPPSSGVATSQLPGTPSVASQPSNLNPSTATSATTTTVQTRQHVVQPPYNRPWPPQQQPSAFQHFSLPPSPPPPPPNSSSSIPNPRSGGGGMAMGVPAHHPTAFSSLTPPPPSFAQQFSRNLTESSTTSTTSQVRQPIQGMHAMGMMGSTSPMRPAGVPPQQLRPTPSSLRPMTSTGSQSGVTQNFQGHSMLRVQSVGFPPSQSHPTTSLSPRAQNQPWLSSGPQGKPPLPSALLRPQMGPQSLHQRSHILSHSSSAQTQQSQPSTSSQAQDHLGPSRIQPLGRGQGSGFQRPSSSHALMQPTMVKPGPPPSKPATLETEEPGGRILSKRSIQEIVAQIDPLEKLDAEVEDILVDVAEQFVESITTFGCSLARHRKSNTLEAKDILLHLERNWNMTLPGFGGDDIRTYKKPFTSDIHKERIAAIKKSALATEMTNAKGSAHAGGNIKSHLAKGPANILGSPNAKT